MAVDRQMSVTLMMYTQVVYPCTAPRIAAQNICLLMACGPRQLPNVYVRAPALRGGGTHDRNASFTSERRIHSSNSSVLSVSVLDSVPRTRARGGSAGELPRRLVFSCMCAGMVPVAPAVGAVLVCACGPGGRRCGLMCVRYLR